MQTEPTDVLYRIKRGISAYVSYLAACAMNEAFSEYVLYEPILRILTARGYSVKCEFECPGVGQPARGDKKRLDFYACQNHIALAIEVKWAKTPKPDLSRDHEKLRAILVHQPTCIPLLCIFGRKSIIESLAMPAGYKERGKAIYADLKATRYGCRVFQLQQA